LRPNMNEGSAGKKYFIFFSLWANCLSLTVLGKWAVNSRFW
jgi:hypothetical protein